MPEQTTGPASVSIVIPAYNEQESLPQAIARTREYLDDRGLTGEIVVVNDGSTDRTLEVAEAAAAEDARVRVVHYGTNLGKGYAVRQGVLDAELEVVVFLDADLATPVEEIDRVLEAMASGAEVV
ncbi:MAG TPA: glycosyl transferase, partial [Armatimonadetes bacterium]|nr:glycosyl transferase [Armatimonadota bacterium]